MSSILIAVALGASAACPPDGGPFPAALAGWVTPVRMQAGADAVSAKGAALEMGRSAALDLVPEGKMRFATSSGRAADAESFAGLAAFHVSAQGRYRVAVDSLAWIDVVSAGVALDSVGHGHGPDCSGIGKMVDFALVPGDYLLQLSGSLPARVRVMVTAEAAD